MVFTNALVELGGCPAASWSSIWYLLSSFAVISCAQHWGYVIFAAAGSFIRAYAVMTFHPGRELFDPAARLGAGLGTRHERRTLGAVKARNMEIVALCDAESAGKCSCSISTR